LTVLESGRHPANKGKRRDGWVKAGGRISRNQGKEGASYDGRKWGMRAGRQWPLRL